MNKASLEELVLPSWELETRHISDKMKILSQVGPPILRHNAALIATKPDFYEKGLSAKLLSFY